MREDQDGAGSGVKVPTKFVVIFTNISKNTVFGEGSESALTPMNCLIQQAAERSLLCLPNVGKVSADNTYSEYCAPRKFVDMLTESAAETPGDVQY